MEKLRKTFTHCLFRQQFLLRSTKRYYDYKKYSAEICFYDVTERMWLHSH